MLVKSLRLGYILGYVGGRVDLSVLRCALSRLHSYDLTEDGIVDGKWNTLYVVFKENIQRRHPVTKKYPILYPIYAVYKAIRFFVLRIVGKKSSLKKISKEIDERKKVYQQLKIFEVEEK